MGFEKLNLNKKVVAWIFLVTFCVSLGLIFLANDFQINFKTLFSTIKTFVFLSTLVVIVYWMIINRSRKNIYIGILLITGWLSLVLALFPDAKLTKALIGVFIFSVLELLLGFVLIICYWISLLIKKKNIYLKYLSMAFLLWGAILFLTVLPFCGGIY